MIKNQNIKTKMKSACSTLIFLFVVFTCSATDFQLNMRQPTAKFVGDSLYNYTVTPWKCVYTYIADGSTETRYYTREGGEKARLDESSFTALNQGPDHRDYYETYRTYSDGRSKLLRNWYNYGVDYGKKKNLREYFYNTSKVDKMGNWIYAEDPHRSRNAYVREIFYYDTPEFDAEEDASIDSRINELVAAVNQGENPFNLDNIAVTLFGLLAKALYIFGLFILFMMTFRRAKLYLWFDMRAAKKITPRGNGLICKALWSAMIPVGIAFYPTAKYVFSGHSTAIVPQNLIIETLVAVVIALIYCLIYVLVHKRKGTARTARWELIFSASIWICLWAAAILAIYIAVIAIIILFFWGMVFGKGGVIPSTVEEGPENMSVISGDGELQHLSRISNGTYIDNKGNIYTGSGGSAHRLSDGKYFS